MTPRRTSLTAIVLGLALPLSACSSGGSPVEDGNARSTSLKPTAWSSAPADAVKSGGTLKLATTTLPTNFNDRVGLGDQVDPGLIAPTRGNAVVIKADGTWSVDRDYAESVKLVDRDPQVVEVELNPKAVWQDGSPIVAKDMIAWWKALNGSNKKFDVNDSTGFEDIKSVKEGADRFTYRVTFARNNADWPTLIYPELPAVVTSSDKAFNKGYAKKAVPSNGPYVISKISGNGKVITQTPNPKWWGNKPKLAKITWRVVDRSAQAQAFANKKIDAVSVGQDKASYDIARTRADSRVQRANGLTWTHLTFNGTRGPLKDVKVRRAIAHAIDREAMSSAASKPLGAPAVTQGSMIYVPGQKGYKDAATAQIGFDVKKSAALLKEAGYSKAPDGLQTKAGKPLTLSIAVPSDTPGNARRARLIQRYLKKVGITVRLDTVSADKYFDDFIVPLNFDMATFNWEGEPFPVSAREPLFHPVDSGQNFTGITSPKLADLWKKADAELDPARQMSLAKDIDKELFSYVPIVPIAQTPTVFVVAKGVVNYGAAQFEHPDFTKVGYKK
ncbi:MAG: ABC transporter family substrate-binding protein [Actinomycetota bacterium]|nr:ABC transporter family substrate-binding protein [Actinomycetota bacterium]